MKKKRFFMTAKEDIPVRELLSKHLPPQHNPEVVLTAGGVWKDKKRILNPGLIIKKQETLKVNVCDFQGKIYSLAPGQIIFENHDLLVVYKPCDLNVHAVPTSYQYDLAYGVNAYLKQQGVPFESTPITRLDRPVEGLVLFAKNKSTERKLSIQIKERNIRKWYTAALEKPRLKEPAANEPAANEPAANEPVANEPVANEPVENEPVEIPKYRRIRDYLSNRGNRTLPDPKGKFADSLFVRTQSLEHADIYSVFIFTGRRHQIRFHAANYIAPVIGDHYYGSNVDLPPDEIALMCLGYNIPLGKKFLRIRIPQHYIDAFHEKIKNASRSRK